ncbi:MAG: CinA family protein [Bdellovibrionia bacterium]
MLQLEESVVKTLQATQTLLYTVESCTGGLIAHRITNVSGASEVFFGSTVAYDNALKEELGVPAELIQARGAVSSEVAQEMAQGGLHKLLTHPYRARSYALLKPKHFICLSTTGIAGPRGGTPEKPVGLCYVGLARSGQPAQVKKLLIPSSLDRIALKTQFATQALEFLEQALQKAIS